LATLFLFAGFFLAFLPHAFHTHTHVHGGLDGETDQWHFIISGMSLVVLSLLLLIWSSGSRISFKN